MPVECGPPSEAESRPHGRHTSGKVRLFNGKTGEPYEQKITVVESKPASSGAISTWRLLVETRDRRGSLSSYLTAIPYGASYWARLVERLMPAG